MHTHTDNTHILYTHNSYITLNEMHVRVCLFAISNEWIKVKKSPPPKKFKTEQDEKTKQNFVLVNDKHTKLLSDPFPFPDNYNPETTVALNNKAKLRIGE